MKTKIEKYHVCVDCQSVGISDSECRCLYEKNYPTIELEFEICKCCGNLMNDGYPSETEFNEKQLELYYGERNRKSDTINIGS